SQLPLARLHAICALDGLKALNEGVILPRLSDEHPRVREHAARLAEQLAGSSAAVRQKLLAMTKDAELRVRYQLAFSLGALPSSAARNQALVDIVQRDAADGYVRMAVLSSLGEGAGEALALLAANETFRDTKEGRELVGSLAAQIGKQQRPEDLV